MEVRLSGSMHHKPVGVRTRIDVLRRHNDLGGGRLLEIGCGNGDYSAALRDDFDLVVATELQWDELPLAQQQGLVVLQTSAGQMCFPNDTFDVVLAIEVLEHVASVQAVCCEVARVMRPGGFFCFTTPNRWFPLETHEVRVLGKYRKGKYLPGLPYLPKLHHRISSARNFKAAEMRSILSPMGLVEVATDYVPLPFDSWERGRRFVKPILDATARGPLRAVTGVSLAGVYRKATR